MSPLSGARPLFRLIVAHDRLRLLAWVAGIGGLVLATAISTRLLHPTQADLDAAAAGFRDNPAAIAYNGPDLAIDTMGGQTVFQVSVLGLGLIGLMNILLVSRLTRGEEESGRLEPVVAHPVSRHAPLAAGLLVAAGTDVAIGAVASLALLQQGLAVIGSLTFGASLAAFGIVFAGITAVTAQVSENPRAAAGAAGGVLALSFALRAVGDTGSGTLSWASPMGWAQQSRPFAGERLSPLLLCVAAGVVLTTVAAVLASHRDFGAGMVAARPGPIHAAPQLRSPFRLGVRLHRGVALWWAVALFALAVVYGSVAGGIDEFVRDNPGVESVFTAAGTEGSITDTYLATALLAFALLAGGPALQILQRLRRAETGHRAEALLANGTSRGAWAGSHLVIALGAGTTCLVAAGAGTGVGYVLTGGDLGEVPRLAGSALVYLPAVALLTALGFALFGLAPRWFAGAWAALAGCLAIGVLSVLFTLPQWVVDVSPLAHTPGLPAAALEVLPVAVLASLASALMLVGLVAYRFRDLPAP